MHRDLWSFSLDFYASPEVQVACLELQDSHGCDVNIVLFLLWNASGNAWFEAEAFAEIDAAVAPWRRHTVEKIRDIRRGLKTVAFLTDMVAQESFRSKVKKLELEAEKLEQAQLERLEISPDGQSDFREAGDRSLASYATHLETRLPSALTKCLLDRLETLVASRAVDCN
ncbi:MAG: TIGR02444 family protein [Mameliella sp.]|nr:TIGR02444 family protein [Mameliella sp.]|tara:strand:- start:260 stop:769 length:510 start_codon:yes stop_codon:yes gene_type:complete